MGLNWTHQNEVEKQKKMDITGLKEKKALDAMNRIKDIEQEEEKARMQQAIGKMDVALSCRLGLAKVNQSRKWLAKHLDVSPTYATLLCNGEKNPNAHMIERLSEVFGVRVSEFISWGEKNDTTSI